MSGPPPCIDLQDLRYRYPDGTFALQGISFKVAAGEKVCLAGPNGAGKSTLRPPDLDTFTWRRVQAVTF